MVPIWYYLVRFVHLHRHGKKLRHLPERAVGNRKMLHEILHFFKARETSITHADHKPLGFLNSDTHEGVFARWVFKLRMLNIKVEYTPGKRKQAADGLSRTICNNKDCSFPNAQS